MPSFPDRPNFEQFDTEYQKRRKEFLERMIELKHQNKKEPNMKITKKYYVGKPGVTQSDWAHSTLDAAIEHAKQLAESQESDQIVVQVVRYVRLQKRPVVVEKV